MLRETLSDVVFVQPGETLVVEAQWYHLAVGEHLEREVDALLAALNRRAGMNPSPLRLLVGVADGDGGVEDCRCVADVLLAVFEATTPRDAPSADPAMSRAHPRPG